MKQKVNHIYRQWLLVILMGASLILLLTTSVLAQGPTSNSLTGNSRYYVSQSGNDTDGLTWDTAFNDIWDALSAANFGDEIWVSAGIYTPGVSANSSFNLVAGVAMYGGFVGDETERDQRDWTANPTILSGDLGGDDTTTNGVVLSPDNIVGTNSFHVVTAQAVAENTILDGFIITAGNATATSGFDSGGGGFYCAGAGNGNQCNPTLTNVRFSGNYAKYGGAMYNDGSLDGDSSLTLTSMIFSGNVAGEDGGAIFSLGEWQGDDSPQLTNVIFLANTAGDDGGAIFNSGGFGSSLVNVTLYNNSANRGGAMANQYTQNVSMTNVVMWGNSANESGNAIFNRSYIELTSSLVQGGVNGPDIVNQEGGTLIDIEGNIAGDPLFVDAVNGNLRLQAESPAIDTGINVLNGFPTDLDGNPRIIHVRTDMGAYETPFYTLSVSLAGKGSGLVSATGIDCGMDCSEEYANGAIVTLTAVATNSAFTGWSGGGCSGTGDCEVMVAEDTAVTAMFSLSQHFIYLPTILNQ